MDQSFKASTTSILWPCADCGCYGAHFCVGKKPTNYSLTEAPPLGPECVVCGNHTVGTMVGAGDGTGRKFIHRTCAMWGDARAFKFSRVSDPSKFETGGINLGHPVIARFAARWLNAALDWWRNW